MLGKRGVLGLKALLPHVRQLDRDAEVGARFDPLCLIIPTVSLLDDFTKRVFYLSINLKNPCKEALIRDGSNKDTLRVVDQLIANGGAII